MDNPVYTKVRAYAMVDGTKWPVTALSIGYRLNDIPIATFSVPIGRDVTSGTSGSPTLAGIFQQGVWAEVTLYIGVTNDPAAEPTYKVAFEGYVISPHSAIKRTVVGGEAFFGVTCIGKAHALQSVVKMTGGINAAVSGSADTAINAAIKDKAVAATAAGALAALKSNPFADMWDTIKQLAENSISNGDPYVNRPISQANATAALNRIADRVSGATSGLNLKSPTDASAKEMLQSQGVNYFADTWFSSRLESIFDDGSLWEAIEQARRDFILYFVPTPTKDYLLPLTFGLGGAPYKTIAPSEYYQLQIPENDTKRPIVDSVILFDSTTPAANAWERAAFKIFAAADFFTSTKKESAVPIIYPMPEWLVPKHPSGSLSEQTLTGQVPDASNPGTETSADLQTYNDGVSGIQGLAKLAARAILYAKAYESRTLYVTGKLRFDVAPGSLVSIQIIGDRFGIGYSGTLYGHVAEAEIQVTGESAATRLTITALRFPDEHAKLNTDGHPLFDAGAITGFPLIEE